MNDSEYKNKLETLLVSLRFELVALSELAYDMYGTCKDNIEYVMRVRKIRDSISKLLDEAKCENENI